ncbi:FAD-dependent oxidoreductase [Candidatus Daviesbacteria bacterium]|nr:FAD-dependent oxidoreductase [Candidatus Daviesbacteria bacterium]
MDQTALYDVIIIGGGPAAVAAAVYCARKKLKSLLITESFGGQSIVSDDIQNWIGDPHISGLDLAKKLEAHVRVYPDMVEIKLPEKVVEVKSVKCEEAARICDFEVKTDNGNTYSSKSVIVAAGARRRRLGVPGEDQFEGKGVAFCSTCDAPLFAGKKVAVVGGGNAGLEAAQDLFKYAQEVYILDFGEQLKGDPVTIDEIQKNPKLKGIINNAQTLEVLGDKLVTGLKYKDVKTNEEKTLEVGGVFVEIGSVPNAEMVKDLVQLDPHGQVMINFQHARTSHPGVFAAGDVTDDPYKQNNISVGDGVRAALSAQAYLQNKEKTSPAAEKHP